jgi:hypothetical protein
MRNDRDAIDAMAGAMRSMGLYIVLVFFAAQFVAFFGHSRLGSILAVLGADLLVTLNLDNPLVFLPFILMCCFVNLMLGSASAQWAVTAPIFVPMLMTDRVQPRGDPGRVPHRRQHDEHHHADDELLRADPRRGDEVQAGPGHRHDGRDDAALLDGVPHWLGRAVLHLGVRARLAGRPGRADG